MQFCTACSSALVPTKREKKILLACPKCGIETGHSNTMIQKLSKAKESVVVIGNEEKKIHALPVTKISCQKCGNAEAFYWMVQTRGGDESSTQFFRCTRCGITWREYA